MIASHALRAALFDPRLTLIALPIGFGLDLVLGDPHGWPHPVRLVGWIISGLDRAVRAVLAKLGRDHPASWIVYLAGVGLVVLTLAAVAGLVGGALIAAAGLGQAGRSHHAWGLVAAWAVLFYYGLAARSLAVETRRCIPPVEAGDLAAGRRAAARIVGRDTAGLSGPEIYRACVETVAENTTDGVVAPLVYAAGGGPLGLWLYKAINTLDSMIGYRSPRYRELGWAAARLDDLAGYLPARLTLLLMPLAGGLVHLGRGGWSVLGRSWMVARRDGRKHPSPNAGLAEAAMAGALAVQLGGPSTYGGRPSVKPLLGDAREPITAGTVDRAIRVMIVTACLALLLIEAVLGTIVRFTRPIRVQAGACGRSLIGSASWDTMHPFGDRLVRVGPGAAMMSDTAVLLVGHGSADPDGVEEFLQLGTVLTARRPDRPVEIGFLEFARPTIQEGVDRLVARGARRIAAVPGMLMAAGHVKNDVPSEINEAKQRYPRVQFHMGRALDIHPQLLQVCRRRYDQAIATRAALPPAETLLLVVGRGSSDPDSNANIAKVARLLGEGYGVGWAETCYIGVTTPLLDDALAVCRRTRFRRIVVQPYFLSTGKLLKKIQRIAAEHAAAAGAEGIEIVTTGHLQADPAVVDVFEERAHEAVHGLPNMNCELCKYRVQIIGHEAALGMPQQGHHHHVRGLNGEYHELPEHHHDHGHHHHPHPGHPPDQSPAASIVPEATEHHCWNDRLLARLEF